MKSPIFGAALRSGSLLKLQKRGAAVILILSSELVSARKSFIFNFSDGHNAEFTASDVL